LRARIIPVRCGVVNSPLRLIEIILRG